MHNQENKTLLIDPKGNVLDAYYKNVPVPLVEPSVVGDGTIPVFDTPYGRLAPVICYDADHQTLIRQAGVAGADILLVPSGDWWHISPYHTYMAVMRGIENGFSVVRQVSGGLSIATDPRGNVLASMDFFKNEEKVNVAYVPTKGIRTIYSVIGDVFAWLCIGGAFVIGLAANRSRKPKGNAVEIRENGELEKEIISEEVAV